MPDTTKQPTTPDVRAGQVWADNDSRVTGRTIRVDEVDATHATCTILTNDATTQGNLDNPSQASYQPKDRRGATTRIAIKRFRPTSTGYRLLTDVPA